MIKKNQPIKFSRPMSSMKLVFDAVDSGTCFRNDLMEATGLNGGQVRSALYNLRYVGSVLIQDDDKGRKMYYTPGRIASGVPACLRGVNSVFNARFTNA